MFFWSYKDVFERYGINRSSGLPLSEGWGASCPNWFILPPPPPRPGFGSGSIISQFLLHHYLGIFSCKRYKHYFSQTKMFTSRVQFGYPCPRGEGGGKLSRLVYLAPCPGAGSDSVNSQFLLHHYLGIYVVVRYLYIILVKLRCLHPPFRLVTLVGGVGGGVGQVVQAGLSSPPPRIWVWQFHPSILIKPLSWNV